MTPSLTDLAQRVIQLERLAQRTWALTSGWPVDAKYVVTEADGVLSQELVIPGLAGHADRAGAGGAGNSWEFDSGPSPFTWNSAPDSENVGATIPSHYYATDTGMTEHIGHIDWAPAGAFDARCKLTLGTECDPMASWVVSVGLIIINSDRTARVLLSMDYNLEEKRLAVVAYTYAGSYTTAGSWEVWGPPTLCLRITRDASNNFNWYFSGDGILWTRFAPQTNFAITVHGIGFRIGSPGPGISIMFASDWLRTNV